ncbi:MAG: DNA topoisomerase I [Nitrososphaerota archaeon]|nr:DNA topoisomerase I [Nitrososphaerota archaeon]MDG6923137.1 DNA topoisomerase I [Nitrososphaerota archaeon]
MDEEYTLVIAEKTDAARKIAGALGGSIRRTRHSEMIQVSNGFDGKNYVICSAVGHLYEVGDPDPNRSIFPVFDIDWFEKGDAPSRSRRNTNARFHSLIQHKVRSFRKAAARASGFINACDYDIEGETIGSNILQFACGNPKISQRAVFSTLTSEDLRHAFSSLEPTMSQLARAGRLRHQLDFLWGVNLSRVLTQSAHSSTSEFANVTIGRVQGPTLAFIVDREITRLTHVPLPSWALRCELARDDAVFDATYKNSPLAEKSTAQTIFDAVSESVSAIVSDKKLSRDNVHPRFPFNIGDLQREAFYLHGMSSSFTLAVAEKLYLKGLISYPRTESQKLPLSIHPEQILNRIASWNDYSAMGEMILNNPVRRKYPFQGTKVDPAHPAIHPTGEIPKQVLSRDEKKLLDMIVRRFLAAFAPDAVVEKSSITFDIRSHEFVTDWEKVVEEGWMRLTAPVKKVSPAENLTFEIGEGVAINQALMSERFSQAPPRYNDASLLAKMESKGIGTKATRADTISTLLKRNYVRRSRYIIPQENALTLVQELRRHCPEILSPEMTRTLEMKLQSLQAGNDDVAQIIADELVNIRLSLRKLSMSGGMVWNSLIPREKHKNLSLGHCPNCKDGSLEAIRSSRTKKRFIRCTNYAKGCKSSSPLPTRGRITPTVNICKICGWPKIAYLRRGFATKIEECSNFSCEANRRLAKRER